MVLTFFYLLTSLYLLPPFFSTSVVFLPSFLCFDLFLVSSIHSMFDLFLIFISLCCFWTFWPLVFTFTFGISDSETRCECRSGDVNKFRFISDITGSFAMSEPFDPGYLEWQKQMRRRRHFKLSALWLVKSVGFSLVSARSRLYACGS